MSNDDRDDRDDSLSTQDATLLSETQRVTIVVHPNENKSAIKTKKIAVTIRFYTGKSHGEKLVHEYTIRGKWSGNDWDIAAILQGFVSALSNTLQTIDPNYKI